MAGCRPGKGEQGTDSTNLGQHPLIENRKYRWTPLTDDRNVTMKLNIHKKYLPSFFSPLEDPRFFHPRLRERNAFCTARNKILCPRMTASGMLYRLNLVKRN